MTIMDAPLAVVAVYLVAVVMFIAYFCERLARIRAVRRLDFVIKNSRTTLRHKGRFVSRKKLPENIQ